MTKEALSFTPEQLAHVPTFAALWPTHGTFTDPKITWLTPDGYEWNFSQIVRTAGRGDEHEAKLREHLLEIETYLLVGVRALSANAGGHPVRTMGGLRDLGLSVDDAQLVFIHRPELRHDEFSDRFEYLTEMSVMGKSA